MAPESSDPREYAQRVRRKTMEYIQDLMEQNRQLQSTAERLTKDWSELAAANDELADDSDGLRERVNELESERLELQERVREAEQLMEDLAARRAEVEEHNGSLANLYVASYLLHEAVEPAEILKVIQEILINLIGTENFLILECEEAGGKLEPISSYGADPHRASHLSFESGPIGDAIRSQQVYVAGDPEAEGLVAAVPMRIGQSNHGLIMIYGLLPHKGVLEPADSEMLELLSSHAGTSLYLGRLHAAHAS